MGRSAADEERRRQKEKQKRRNAAERKFQREARSLAGQPEALKKELLSLGDAEGKTDRLKRKAVADAYAAVLKKQHVDKHERARAAALEGAGLGPGSSGGPPPGEFRPEDSVY